MNIIIASDSYKGSLSTNEVANHIKKGVQRVYPNASFEVIPMADGGEGTVNAMVSTLGGKIEETMVCGPDGTQIKAHFGILNNQKAIIEMASASGLPLMKQKDIMNATTYGTGELIKRALDLNCKHIYIGIGGSATNDGGVGMAQALGISFLDENNNEIPRGAIHLSKIKTIDTRNLDKRLATIEITVMCDVNNPLCGPNGASYVYGPQKGASEDMLEVLDSNLLHLANVCKRHEFNDLKDMPGAGAAGGLGFALVTFFNATIRSGIDSVLEAAHFNDKLDWADLVISGEGRIDEQSLNGKVCYGVAAQAYKKQIPTIAIVGCIGDNARLLFDHGISAIESCINKPCSLDDALLNAAENVEDAAERAMRLISVGIAFKF